MECASQYLGNGPFSGSFFLRVELPLILMWVAVWGIVENIMTIYLGPDSNAMRIFFYVLLGILALVLHVSLRSV